MGVSNPGAAYTDNAYLINYDGLVGRAMGALNAPVDVMMFMDGQSTFVISSTNTRAGCLSAMGTGLKRHNDGANVAFCDGHVKWMQGSAISGAIPAAGVYSDFLAITME